MTRIEVVDGAGVVLLTYDTDEPNKVKFRSEVNMESGHAVAWLEDLAGEIIDSIEMDTTTLPRGLHRLDYAKAR